MRLLSGDRLPLSPRIGGLPCASLRLGKEAARLVVPEPRVAEATDPKSGATLTRGSLVKEMVLRPRVLGDINGDLVPAKPPRV